VVTLQAIAIGRGFGEITRDSRGLVGAAAGIGGAKIVPGFQEPSAGLGQQSGGVLDVEFEKQLAFFDLLTLENVNFFNESVELGADDVRRDRFYFAVTADGGDDIFAAGIDSGKFGDGLAAAESD